jgi:hypothetical protein
VPSNSAAIRVGRLLEVCIDAGFGSTAEVDRHFDRIEEELAKIPSTVRHYTVADWTRCPVMAPEVAERVVARMSKLNARVGRSAALASKSSPGALLQFLRLIREAGHPDRRLFFDAPELLRWMGEELDATELARLKTMLKERSQIP